MSALQSGGGGARVTRARDARFYEKRGKESVKKNARCGTFTVPPQGARAPGAAARQWNEAAVCVARAGEAFFVLFWGGPGLGRCQRGARLFL